MLRDANQTFTEAANLPENVFEAVGDLFLMEAFRKKIVNFFKKNDVAQGISFSLPQAIEMNPPQLNFTEKNAQRLGQFLIQFNNQRLFEQFFQFDRITRIEGASGRAKGESFQNSGTGVLPEHSSSSKAHSFEELSSIKEVWPSCVPALIDFKLLKLFVEHLDEDVRHSRPGDVGLFQSFGNDADPGLGMHSWRFPKRIPVKGRGA